MSDERQALMVNVPGGDLLLLPNLAVREVLSMERLQAAAGPDWLAGRCDTAGQSVPVVRWEGLRGQSVPQDTRRTRITIVNAIGDGLDPGQYGLVTHGHPHLVTVSRAALAEAPVGDDDDGTLVWMRVRIANSVALVPDLESLEGQIAAVQPDGH